jgi:hypothetical protein
VPRRRLRANPRVVKRKMSGYGAKRSEHRRWPQPTRNSADAVGHDGRGVPDGAYGCIRPTSPTSLRPGSGTSVRGGSEIPGDTRAGSTMSLRRLTTFLTISLTTDGFDASMTADRSGRVLTTPHFWVVTLEDGSPHWADQGLTLPTR